MLWHKTINNNKPPLILLHGWGFNADVFNPILPKLNAKYSITLIDLPGHGRSNFVAGKLDDWVAAILPIVTKGASIVGWSLGGLVAIKLAQLIEAKSLYLIASAPCLVNQENWNYVIDKETFAIFCKTLNSDPPEALKNFIKLQLISKKHLATIYSSIEKHPVSIKGLNQGLNILKTTDLRPELLALKSKVEVILGQKDTLVNAKIANWFGKKNIKTTMLESGHLPFLHPDFVL